MNEEGKSYVLSTTFLHSLPSVLQKTECFPKVRLLVIIPVRDRWDKWKSMIQSGQNSCCHIRSPNMSYPQTCLLIFFAWQISTLENSAQRSYLPEPLPRVLEHPTCSSNTSCLALPTLYELTRYYLLSLFALDYVHLMISDCMVGKGKTGQVK